ncbi:MAG TPA: hypothetical protein DCE42_07825 [Myxococcales bacterium]|nr:hypothetical protein [Deltaproteobacteria bacterium]HAA54651.1 hypothetical protein [Myxococcales bacterium]|tara:strand:- start:22891 stop:26868 length:3978 start_codon:yes stop_codon:yes gene_type:complete
MSTYSHDIIHALWFIRHASEGGFAPADALLEELFTYLQSQPTHTFPEALSHKGLLTPFQCNALQKKLPPLPTHLHPPTQSALPPTDEERYILEEVIQQGGSGRIHRAFDKIIGRKVAIKTLHHPDDTVAQERFENEYKITGQLEHPNIISIHDASTHPELGPFYVMRLLEGNTLREVLRTAHDQGVPSRTSLLRTFLEISAAMAYAHSKGILHRDLKPSNIMVGELGEAQVMDWGIALQLRDDNLPTPPPQTQPLSSTYEVVGTPGYMAPEQLSGSTLIDERADIFSLGCILYELTTGRLPFHGTQLDTYQQSLQKGLAHPPHHWQPNVPEEIEEIILKTLSIDPEERYRSVRELSSALTLYLEGTRTRKLRQQRALSKVLEGIEARTQLEQKEQSAQELLGELRGKQTRIRPYDALEKKLPLWEKEKQVERLQKEAMVWLGEAYSAFTQALALDPESKEARGQLADLYHVRLIKAEAQKDPAQEAFNESMLRRYHDGGYEEFLRGEGQFWLISDPPGAQVTLYGLEEHAHRLQAVDGQALGTTPLGPKKAPMGSYIAHLQREGFADTIVPILVQRNKKHVYRGRLYKTEDMSEDVCYMPQGRFIMGGDPLTASAGRTEHPFIDDLWVCTLPVTMGEYIEFLNDFKDKEQARQHVPRRSPDGGYYLFRNDEGIWQAPEVDEEGDEWDLAFPVLAISWHDAKAYADWKAKVTGKPYRLPKAAELEKAARGVDGRYYPWGDHFDATFCKMGKSRPGPPKPEPVGVFEADISVYNVRDLAGGIREWCGDDFDPPDGALAFGGNWSGSELTSRAAHRWVLQKGQVAPGIGMRLVLDAPTMSYHEGFASPPERIPQEIKRRHVVQETPPTKRSEIRKRLSDPGLWSALAENRDEWVLTQLVLAVTSQDITWAMIIDPKEEWPLASAGDAPEKAPDVDNTPYTFYPCKTSEEIIGYLVLPENHHLLGEEQTPLCAAIALVLKRKQEQKRAHTRETKAIEEAHSAQKQLTIIKEAFATVAPETYLNETYPLIDGRSPSMRRLFRLLDRVTQSQVNVLIRGESGVGKERVARSIHQNGPTADGPFVPVNCGAIPENLIESEFFGYVKGAFTGAERDQTGLFQQAHNGTLFLDEIGELPLDAQVKLLRALQNRAVRPVGGYKEYPFEARILAATHRDLKQLVDEGTFREDLYWRLVVLEVEVPPLRKRPEDIPTLIQRFLSDWHVDAHIPEETMELLQAYEWPGNVRELENELRRALVIAEGTLDAQAFSRKIRRQNAHEPQRLQGTLRDIVAEVERNAIALALEQANGNKAETARKLGLSKRGLQLKMKRYQL